MQRGELQASTDSGASLRFFLDNASFDPAARQSENLQDTIWKKMQ